MPRRKAWLIRELAKKKERDDVWCLVEYIFSKANAKKGGEKEKRKEKRKERKEENKRMKERSRGESWRKKK